MNRLPKPSAEMLVGKAKKGDQPVAPTNPIPFCELCVLCGYFFFPSASGFNTWLGLPAAKLTRSSTTVA